MLFELGAAAIVGVFGICLYSMMGHFFRELNAQ
jgi:hypothetical protein